MKKTQSKSSSKKSKSGKTAPKAAKKGKAKPVNPEAPAVIETAPAEAADIAATVEVVETGNLADGVAVPHPKRARQPKMDKPKRISALDGAAEVLRTTGGPMRCKDLIVAMQDQGLWSSPKGQTPAATLYSAILREIAKKADQSRFRKTDRGLFEATA